MGRHHNRGNTPTNEPNMAGIVFADGAPTLPPQEAPSAEPASVPAASPNALAPPTMTAPEELPEMETVDLPATHDPQENVRRAIANMRREWMVRKEANSPAPQPVLPPLSAVDQARLAPRIYRVKNKPAIELPRGGSTVRLYFGKIVTDRDFSIPALIEQGVELEEVIKT